MTNIGTLLEDLRRSASQGNFPDRETQRALNALPDGASLRKAGKLLASMEAAQAGAVCRARIGLSGTYTLDPFSDLLRATLVAAGIAPQVRVRGYRTLDHDLTVVPTPADDDNEFLVCLWSEEQLLPEDWRSHPVAELVTYIERRTEELALAVARRQQESGSFLVLHTIPLPRTVSSSFIAVQDRARIGAAWHSANATLLSLSQGRSQTVCIDWSGALADECVPLRDERLHRFADISYTDDALRVLAGEIRRVVQAAKGRSRKALVLDADNTLWGGIAGEVGTHGVELGGMYPGNCYQELQAAAAQLRAQGVILSLASKNDPETVDEVLRDHRDSLLPIEAFAVRAVGWQAKTESIRDISAALDLPPDAVAFMDDSPHERALVRAEYDDLAVISAAGDPAHLAGNLVREGHFDVLELTETDRRRPVLYRSRALRASYAHGFRSTVEFLEALETRIAVAKATTPSIPRLAQLAARTNQFNLTGRRFGTGETSMMLGSQNHVVAGFSVEDRFGDEGLVGGVWVSRTAAEWRLLNIVLSCRVLGRGVELAIVHWLTISAAAAGAVRVVGEFVPSSRNKVAADLWSQSGFERVGQDNGGEKWMRTLDQPAPPVPKWLTLEDAG